MKTLIVYYSRKGQNYTNTGIASLTVGNTEVIAKKIQALTGGDLFEIDTIKPYPVAYDETVDMAKAELKADARPEIKGSVSNIDEYGTIYLGYPNWWGTMPMAVFTFLETHDLSGKTIAPFCTHEGSGMGGEGDIKKLCPNAKILPGLAIRGSNVNKADKDVEAWLKKSV